MALPEISLPADLPIDWKNGDIITPDGTSVGLTPQHGYNALNQYVNDAQSAINALRDYLSGGIDAETAKKLAVARTIQTDLSKAVAASFDGSSNITPGVTGTLPIARGGTGLSTSPSALVNLESTAAANILQASPRPGVTGTLPVAKGGTGATTAAGALSNLGAAPAYTYGTEDLTAGESELATGTLYLCYE